MNLRSLTFVLCGAALSVAIVGCMPAPGKPGAQVEAARPGDVRDFPTLYKQNCAGCHGDSGKNGAAISLANPVYLATAGFDNLQRITAAGVPGTAMPGFAKAAGGTLTDAQISILAKGMIDAWEKPDVLNGMKTLPYVSQSKGDPAQGAIAFHNACSSCHGADGAGKSGTNNSSRAASIVDPSYLALVSDQGLRSIIIAGNAETEMPDWRSDLTAPNGRPLTDEEITGIVAWIASHRTTSPGQPYPQDSKQSAEQQ